MTFAGVLEIPVLPDLAAEVVDMTERERSSKTQPGTAPNVSE
jgi:hypothetical protein